MNFQSRYRLIFIGMMFTAAIALAGCGQRGAPDQRSANESGGQKAADTGAKLSQRASDVTAKVGQAADDTAITARVKAALIAEPGLKSRQIDVETKDATVTLSGNVNSADERDRAKELAGGIEGVKNVVDAMSVKSSTTG